MKSLPLAIGLFAGLLLVSVFCVAANAVEPKDVPVHLQKNCVTVRAAQSSGSGTIIVREIEGKKVAFVWTAYHVVDGLREIKSVLSGGSEKKVVTYRDAEIVQELINDGSTVGDTKLYCKVLTTSPKNDIALLQVRLPGFYQGGVEFVLDKSVTPVGTELFHCGSPSGQELGHNSITAGIIAANGRLFDQLPYDQTTCSALPGSSGGVVALKTDGRYVGMLTLGISGTDTFNYIVPARRIVEWCEKQGILWAVDAKAPAPTNAALMNLKVEDTISNPEAARSASDSAPTGLYYLIREACEPTPAASVSILFRN